MGNNEREIFCLKIFFILQSIIYLSQYKLTFFIHLKGRWLSKFNTTPILRAISSAFSFAQNLEYAMHNSPGNAAIIFFLHHGAV